MASVKWGASALDDLENIDSVIVERILGKVTWLEKNLSTIVPEQLGWGLRGLYKLRVGDYRIIYSLQREVILIQAVKHRREVYKK